MKIKLFAIFMVFMFILSGCTQMYNSNEVSIADTNEILSYKMGVIEDIKYVTLKDDGSGTMIGAMTGTVLGGLFGKGKGNVLTTLIGGLGGAYVGNKLDKANAEELFIKLVNGGNIVTIVKGVKLKKGDKVRIIMNGSRIVRVEKF